jgi:hypothetical protein
MVADEMMAPTGCVTRRVQWNTYAEKKRGELGKNCFEMTFGRKMFRKKTDKDESHLCIPLGADGKPDPYLFKAFHKNKGMVYDPPAFTQLRYKDENGIEQPQRELAFHELTGMQGHIVACGIHPNILIDGAQDKCGVMWKLDKVFYLRPWQPMMSASANGKWSKQNRTPPPVTKNTIHSSV